MKEIEEVIVVAVLVALVAAFVVLLTKKWGIAEWMQIHGDRYMSQLFSCDLCMSFWASVILTVIIVAVTDQGQLMLVPVLSTPIARQLV